MKISTAKLNRKNDIFFIVFLFMLIIVWSPFKKLAYILPSLSLLLFYFLSADLRFVLRGALFIFFILLYGAIVALLIQSGIVINMVFFVVTFSSLSILFAVDNTYCDQKELYFRISDILFIVLLIEAAIGIVQACYGCYMEGTFDGSVGDYVEGTINIGLFGPSHSFSNPIYATNICFYIFYLFPGIGNNKVKLGILSLGTLSVILASVMHLLLFFVLSLFLAVLLLEKGKILKKSYFKIFIIIAAFGLAVYHFMPSNFYGYSHKYNIIKQDKSPKVIISEVVFKEFPKVNWITTLFGVGPGQFASRASHLSSGYLIADFSRNFGGDRSKFFRMFMDPLLNWIHRVYPDAGSTENPFFSWLMVYSEFGLFGVLFTLFIFKKGFSIKKYYDSPDPFIKSCTFATVVILFFVFLIGFQDSYWEVPQSVLIGIFLLHNLVSFIKKANAEEKTN